MIKRPDLSAYELERTEKLAQKVIELEETFKQVQKELSWYKKYFIILAFLLLGGNLLLLVPVFLFQKYVPLAFTVGLFLFLILIYWFYVYKKKYLEINEEVQNASC